MLDVGFISDLHFGHLNMAIKRGYKDLDTYHKDIIDKYNSVAGKKTMMIIPGDITMEKKSFYPLLNELNGRKIIVGGNHDLREHSREMLNFVESIVGALEYKGCIVTHIPIHASEVDRFRFNIHGHTHEHLVMRFFYNPLVVKTREEVDKRYKNVSWERLNGVPVSMDQVINSL